MCDVYFSDMYDGRCVAVDGMAQAWDAWPHRAGQHKPGRPLLWLFPPVSTLLNVLRKVETERAQAIVVLPRRVSAEVTTLLYGLPIVHQRQLTGPHSVMVQPTSRVPAQTAVGGWKVPMQAVHVRWPGA